MFSTNFLFVGEQDFEMVMCKAWNFFPSLFTHGTETV